MSFTTDPGVQPDTGQGAASEAPYAEYLNSIPEEHRAMVEPAFKKWDADTTKRFQEHSEFRKQWEPYAETGIHQLPPETVQGLAQLAQMDQGQFTDWLREQANAAGLIPQENSTEDLSTLVDPSVEQLVKQQLSPIEQQLQQFQQWQEQQQIEQARAQAHQQIQQQLEQLKAQHGEFDVGTVEKLTANYIDQDPRNAVQQAFKDYQSLVAQIEQGAFQRKLEQPQTPQTAPGLPEGVQAPKTLEEARKVMDDVLSQQQRM